MSKVESDAASNEFLTGLFDGVFDGLFDEFPPAIPFPFQTVHCVWGPSIPVRVRPLIVGVGQVV